MTDHKFFDTQQQADKYASEVMEFSPYTAYSYWCNVNQIWVVEVFKKNM